MKGGEDMDIRKPVTVAESGVSGWLKDIKSRACREICKYAEMLETEANDCRMDGSICRKCPLGEL